MANEFVAVENYLRYGKYDRHNMILILMQARSVSNVNLWNRLDYRTHWY